MNASLEILGDRWSLLIVRDLMFRGRNTFKEFAEAGEGIASNILTQRLEQLQAEGIIDKRPDPADGRRVIYGLTEKGIDLAPVLVELVLWVTQYEKTDAPPATLREMRKHRERALAEIRERWEEGHRAHVGAIARRERA